MPTSEQTASKNSSLKAGKNYSFKVGKNFFERIQNHISILKALNKKSTTTKRKWIAEAIRNKLDRAQDPETCIALKQKTMSLQLERELEERLEEQVLLLKDIHGSYSKKLWILESIQEKLDEEELQVKEEFAQAVTNNRSAQKTLK